MLAIKFQRIGKKHQPTYRVVVAPKRSKMAAPPVEDVGFYDPRTKKAQVVKERIAHWIKMGAKPTPSVHNLLVREKVIEGAKIAISIRKKKGVEVPAPSAQAQAAAPVAETTFVPEAPAEASSETVAP